MTEREIAETFLPGDFIKEELEARGWSQIDLAEILGRPPRLVSEIILGKRSISPETAKGLGDAFGTGAQFWMNLESAYQLSVIKSTDNTVARRSRLYERFPAREMLRRHWIEPSNNIDVLEKRFCNFFALSSIDEEPKFAHAARKQSSYKHTNSAQCAWLCRARQLAQAITVSKFTEKSFADCLEHLRMILPNAEEVRKIPRILAEAGVRFLIIEPLPHTRIDGVCFWLDKSSPVIALSLRYDRIDWFWHTLLHEIKHVKNHEGLDTPTLDIDMVGDNAQRFEEKPRIEYEADTFATEFSIRKSELDNFIARIRPLYSKQKIQGFANRIKVHPGIVVGQLQYRREIPYTHSREMLVKVRHIVTEAALTDGWGHTPVLTAPRKQEVKDGK